MPVMGDRDAAKPMGPVPMPLPAEHFGLRQTSFVLGFARRAVMSSERPGLPTRSILEAVEALRLPSKLPRSIGSVRCTAFHKRR